MHSKIIILLPNKIDNTSMKNIKEGITEIDMNSAYKCR